MKSISKEALAYTLYLITQSLCLEPPHIVYRVGPHLHLHAGPSNFFLCCTSKAYYVLDAVLNIISEQPFEAGNCCEGKETEVQSQGTEPGQFCSRTLTLGHIIILPAPIACPSARHLKVLQLVTGLLTFLPWLMSSFMCR